jgi:hypothetical protein
MHLKEKRCKNYERITEERVNRKFKSSQIDLKSFQFENEKGEIIKKNSSKQW